MVRQCAAERSPELGRGFFAVSNKANAKTIAFLAADQEFAQNRVTGAKNLDTKKALEDAGMREKLFAQGLAPVGNTPEQMGAAMKAETVLWKSVVGARKIQVK